jgi:hypothetical protein
MVADPEFLLIQKKKAALGKRAAFLCGFVVLRFASLKPGQMMAMADAGQLGSELGDHWPAPGLRFAPSGRRRESR